MPQGHNRHPNKRVKVKERAMHKAQREKGMLVLDRPVPLLDIGEERVSELIKSVTGKYEDSFQEAWVRILDEHASTEEDILRIAKEVYRKDANQVISEKYKLVSGDAPINFGSGEASTVSIFDRMGEEDEGIKFIQNDYQPEKLETRIFKKPTPFTRFLFRLKNQKDTFRWGKCATCHLPRLLNGHNLCQQCNDYIIDNSLLARFLLQLKNQEDKGHMGQCFFCGKDNIALVDGLCLLCFDNYLELQYIDRNLYHKIARRIYYRRKRGVVKCHLHRKNLIKTGITRQISYQLNKARSLCQICGKPAIADQSLCLKHRLYFRNWIHNYYLHKKKQQECIKCHKPAMPTHVFCLIHLLEHRVRNRIHSRLRYQYRVANHLCNECGIPLLNGKHRCDKCLARRQENKRRLHPPKERIRTGEKRQCRMCGKDLGYIKRYRLIRGEGKYCGLCWRKRTVLKNMHKCPPHHWKVDGQNIGHCLDCNEAMDYNDLLEQEGQGYLLGKLPKPLERKKTQRVEVVWK